MSKMSVVEKATNAIDYLKNPDNTSKIHELQNYAGVLGQCMGAIGGHPSMVEQFSMLLQQTIPVLLSLCSHSSAEVRLVGDETLNRVVVSGMPFHASKVHLHLHNNISSNKSPRWLRAALSRICLGRGWLRAGGGRGRLFAQNTLPKLREAVDRLRDPATIAGKGDVLLMECLEANLPRIMKALAPFATRDEMFGLLKSFLQHVDSSTAPIRRGSANCIADLCQYHQKKFVIHIVNAALDALMIESPSQNSIIGWFGTLRALFNTNAVAELPLDVLPLERCMQIYQVCLTFLESTANDHNIHNAAMECLNTMLSEPSAAIKSALINPEGLASLLRATHRGHFRTLSSASMVQSIISTASSTANLSDDLLNDQSESFAFHGTLLLGSMSQHQTPYRSLEDLSMKGINTPDSPCDSMMSEMNNDMMTGDSLASYVKEKLDLKGDDREAENSEMMQSMTEDFKDEEQSFKFKLNIGSFYDADVPLKYCTRLLVSRFLLPGYSGQIISDRVVRVSVKASAISCLSSIVAIYPEAMMMFLDKDGDNATHNISGNSEFSNASGHEQLNDFVLERNVCYQESMTDSYCQEMLSKSIDMMSQASGASFSHKHSSSQKNRLKPNAIDSPDNSSSLAAVHSNILDSKQQNTGNVNQMGASVFSDMTGSNFTMGSNMTASNDPLSTDFLMTTSVEPLTSSLDLEMKFDHFGESSTSLDDPAVHTEFELNRTSLEQRFKSDRQISSDSKSDDIEDAKISRKQSSDRNHVLTVLQTVEENCNDVFLKSQDSERPLVKSHAKIDYVDKNDDFFHQHVCEVVPLLEGHLDPQIRGLVRVCVGSYLNAALDASLGDYARWKPLCSLIRPFVDSMQMDKLINVILKGFSDEIHSCVNNSISAITRCIQPLCTTHQDGVVSSILSGLRCIEDNAYWLCKVNLCRLYEKLPYQRMSIILPDWSNRCIIILDIVMKLLEDQDHRVRRAATEAIARFPSVLHMCSTSDSTALLSNLAKSYSEDVLFSGLRFDPELLADFKNTFVLSELPGSFRDLKEERETSGSNSEERLSDNLKSIVSLLSFKLMESNCKFFTQGCLETLLELTLRHPPTKYPEAYADLGLLDVSLQLLEHRTLPASCCQTLLAFVTQIYAIESWNTLKASGDYDRYNGLLPLDDSKQDGPPKPWVHLGRGTFSARAEALLRVTMKMLYIFVHVIEDVVPIVFQKSTSIIPASPIRRKTGDSIQKRNSNTSNSMDASLPEDKSTSRKRVPYNSMTGQFTAVGYCANDGVFMKLYGSLRAAYSSHKVSVDSSLSVFLKFVSTTLDSLAVQLEVMTEREAGRVAEELLYYLKCILPLKPDSVVTCVTQILKCLSSVNMTAYRHDLKTFFNKSSNEETEKNINSLVDYRDDVSFYNDVLMANLEESVGNAVDFGSQRRGSNDSRWSASSARFRKEDRLNPDRECYARVKNFAKSKLDKKWSANKQELARYLRLIEPVVIQALKSYTIQNNVTLQCKVLELLNQLLALRVNYCLLDSDQVFIGFVLKQLENIEHHEILECGELVRCIFTFLVHLSSAKHHSKQLMDIPKLIQLCDGLMASGVHEECVESLHPVAYRVFVWGGPTEGRLQAQEAQVTKEVLFAMLQKMMHHVKVINLVSSILLFSEEHPEGHFRWSQLACDTALQLLRQKALPLHTRAAFCSLERLLGCIHGEVLLEPGRLESVLGIMLDKPPDQDYASKDAKERWLSTVLLLLRKIVSNHAESEVLLSLDQLKTAHVSPAAIFFSVRSDIDPLNVQTFNENCANLSPDVVFVRFLFRALTYCITEMEGSDEGDLSNAYWSSLTVGFICQVKHILHLKDGCRFPLLAKTAQSVLRNEQSGLNTGLYSPEENIPIPTLTQTCSKLGWRCPLLALHWDHLLARLGLPEPGACQGNDGKCLHRSLLRSGATLAACEHFVDNGLDEAISLTWLLVNRTHVLVQLYPEKIIRQLLEKVNANPSASGLLLQAIAARCQPNIKGIFGLKVHRILSGCHASQSGPLLLLVCRLLAHLDPSNARRFAHLAVQRCRHLAALTVDEMAAQLIKEDMQLVIEALQRNQLHVRHAKLVQEVNVLASAFFDLSPLDLSQDRPINAQYIKTTGVDTGWFVKQVKNRCYQTVNEPQIFGRFTSTAQLLVTLNADQLKTIVDCPEFDNRILRKTVSLGTESYVKRLVEKISEWESAKVEIRNKKIKIQQATEERNNARDVSNQDSNILNIANNFVRFKKNESQSQFFITVKDAPELITGTDDGDSSPREYGKLKIDSRDEKSDIVLPEFDALLTISLVVIERSVAALVSLFPRQSRPLSQFDTGAFNESHTMDKYTRRCFQVFRDKLFHQELMSVQALVTSYLECLDGLENVLKSVDCDIAEKIINLFIPKSFAKALMSFTVISLQYTSYLIKLSEGDVFALGDAPSYRGSGNRLADSLGLNNALDVCIGNAARAFSLCSVWKELNAESNSTRVQSAINCLYTYVRQTVKDTLPLTAGSLASSDKSFERGYNELSATCDRFLSLLRYWEKNIYDKVNTQPKNIMSFKILKAVEKLLVMLCRCDFASMFTLIPPLAWGDLDIFEDMTKPTLSDLQADDEAVNKNPSKPERRLKKQIVIPINCLQDMDVLEQFLFRVNLIGWTNKNTFEEIWMSLLAALQGNGTHWAVRGMMQLLMTTDNDHCARGYTQAGPSIQKLKSVALDCKLYDQLFSDVNLESVPFAGCTYAPPSIEYLQHAAGLNDNPDIKVQNALKRNTKNLQSSGVDLNSCLQLLMDIATQMSLPQSGWGLGARSALLCCLVHASDVFCSSGQWRWLAEQLATALASCDPSDLLAHQHLVLGLAKTACVLRSENQDTSLLTTSLTSTFAPLRVAALRAAILHLSSSLESSAGSREINKQSFNGQLTGNLIPAILPHLTSHAKISYYEQSLCWSALFSLVDCGSTDLLKTPQDLLLTNHSHFCYELILRGVCRAMYERSVSYKYDDKTSLLKTMTSQPELARQLLPLLLVQTYAGDGLPADGALEPEQLLARLQTAACLQTAALGSRPSAARSLARALASVLAAFLPPAAALSRAAQGLLDCCKAACDKQRGINLMPFYVEMMAEIVNKVFETSIEQSQLPILSGWLFDVLGHLFEGKIPNSLIPFVLLSLVTCSSGSAPIRSMSPSVFHTLKTGFSINQTTKENRHSYQSDCSVLVGINAPNKNNLKLCFSDRRLLCLGAVHSGYTNVQIDKLKGICVGNEMLDDLNACLEGL